MAGFAGPEGDGKAPLYDAAGRPLSVDDDELAGVVAAEPRVEIVLRAAHRADPRDHAGGLGGLCAARGRVAL